MRNSLSSALTRGIASCTGSPLRNFASPSIGTTQWYSSPVNLQAPLTLAVPSPKSSTSLSRFLISIWVFGFTIILLSILLYRRSGCLPDLLQGDFDSLHSSLFFWRLGRLAPFLIIYSDTATSCFASRSLYLKDLANFSFSSVHLSFFLLVLTLCLQSLPPKCFGLPG